MFHAPISFSTLLAVLLAASMSTCDPCDTCDPDEGNDAHAAAASAALDGSGGDAPRQG